MPRAVFAQASKLILSALQPFSASTEYGELFKQYEFVLTLCDRLLAATEANVHHGDLPKRIIRILDDIRAEPHARSNVGSELLRGVCEAWLKAILHHVDPERYAAMRIERASFTLHNVMGALSLVTPQELEHSEDVQHSHPDPVRRSYLQMKHLRNEVSHEAPLLNSSADPLVVALASIVGPVFLHRQQLKKALSRLIVERLACDDGYMSVLAMQRSERERHLKNFRGRRDVLTDLEEMIARKLSGDGGYLLLLAPEGFGKSAIAAQLSENLRKGMEPLGLHAPDVQAVCPWLPAVIYHSGKQESNSASVVDLIVHQANTRLVRQVSTLEARRPDLGYFRSDGGEAGAAVSADQEFESVKPTNQRRAPVMTHRAEDQTAFRSLLRSRMHAALDRLAIECGSVLLVIDSLDEIFGNGGDLGFLPPSLPENVVILLTSRNEDGVLSSVRRDLHPREIALEGLGLNEVRELTGVSDDAWNEQLLLHTRGAPLLVRSFAESVEAHGGNHAAVDLHMGPKEVLKSQVRRWSTGETRQGNIDVLGEILKFLAVFEPVSPVSADLVQSYLIHKGADVSGEEVRSFISRVSSQLDSSSEGLVKLSVRAFAEFVRMEVLGLRDLRRQVAVVARWLVEDEDVSADMRARFVAYWSDPAHVPDAKVRDQALNVVSALIAEKTPADLFRFYRTRPGSEDVIPPPFLKALRAAADKGHESAMFALGRRLLSGKGIPKDVAEGRLWLRRASDAGNIEAAAALGESLIDSLDADEASEGEVLLNKAAEGGSSYAIGLLCIRAAQKSQGGDVRGELIQRLRLFAETSGETARLMLGTFLLNTKEVEARNEGLGILEGLADGGNTAAMMSLAQFYFSPKRSGDLQSDASGERWLRRAASTGNHAAMRDLGIRYLSGNGVPQSQSEGSSLLRRAIQDGSTDALYHLGVRLLLGDGVEQDVALGVRHLREAANRRFPPAQYFLGVHLLDGVVVPRMTLEGRQLLAQAASAGFASAMTAYGWRQIEGDGFNVDVVDGVKWLKQAIESGDTYAMAKYADFLLRKGPHHDPSAAEGYLRKAIANGGRTARYVLAESVLDGLVPGSANDAAATLEELAREDHPDASEALLKRLIYGKGMAKDPSRVAEMVNGEVARAEPRARIGFMLYRAWRDFNEETYLRAAVGILLAAHADSPVDCGNNLGYLVRRGQIPDGVRVPSLTALLKPGIEKRYSLALVNEALRRIQGVDCRVDWDKADALFAELRFTSLSDVRDVLEWWHECASKYSDSEGHLVIAMLLRHGLVMDPDGMSIRERIGRSKVTFPANMQHVIPRTGRVHRA